MDLWSQALALADGDSSATVKALIGLSNGHLRTGDTPQAKALLERARRETRSSGDRIAEGRVLNNLGLVHVFNQEYDDALIAFHHALRVRESTGYSRGIVINHHNIGDVHFTRGDFAKAYSCFRRSQDLAHQMSWQVGVALNAVYLAYIDGIRTLDEGGLARLGAATERARRLNDADIVLTGEWLTGRLLLELGRPSEALETLKRARAQADGRHQLRMARTLDALISRL